MIDLTAEEPAHDVGEVLELRGGDARDAVRVLHRRDAAAQPEHETAAGQALHGARDGGGDHRVAGVVVGGGGGDLNTFAHRAGGT